MIKSYAVVKRSAVGGGREVSYESWRISYQSSEQAARAAYAEIEKLRREVEELAESLAELITWIPSADTYRRLGFNPEAAMWALEKAERTLGKMGGLSND